MRNRLLVTFVSALVTIPPAAGAAELATVPATLGTPAISIYLARPHHHGDVRSPAIVLLHGCEGLTGFEALAADKLAEQGYVGVAIDALGPSSPNGVCGAHQDGAAAEAEDARATLAWLQTQTYVDPDRFALVGFSMGAIAILDIVDPIDPIISRPLPAGLRAAIAFYPSCAERSGNISIPLAIFDGDADQITPAAPCMKMADAAKAAGNPVEITTYPGATHAFNVPKPDRTLFGKPLRFDATASADALQKSALFLAQHLRAQSS